MNCVSEFLISRIGLEDLGRLEVFAPLLILLNLNQLLQGPL